MPAPPARIVREAISNPRWRRRLLVVLLVLGLSALPLLGSLGYEHAFVLSPLFALLGMGVGVDIQHRARREGCTTHAAWLRGAATELGILHGLAIFLTLLGGLWQRGCDPLGGLGFYAMGPLISSVLGATCGVWGGTLATGRARAYLLAATPMVFCIVVGLWRLYADPVVYAFDPFFGYFSGSVYDESVSVTNRYLRFRGYNLLAGASAALAWWWATRPRGGGGWELRRGAAPGGISTGRMASGALIALLVAGSVTIGLRGSHYGFTANDRSLEEVLPLRRETDHFVIDYAPRTADARTIDLIAAEHEFAYDRLRTLMNGREPDAKVHSFVFRDRDQKRKAMGAGTVQVAAPWRHQIYLDHREFPHPILHHELAHIFGNTVGDPIFGVARDGLHLNIGLIEGFATAMAPRASDRLDLHDQVEALTALGLRPKLAAIMGPGFLSQSSRVAYTTAGSFCLWLIETRGFDPMGTFYRTAGDAQAAYGESLEALEAQWLNFLEARNGITPGDVEAQAQRFKRGSVFARPCAHKVAAVRREIGKAAGAAQFDEAVEAHQELCALEPQQPAHKLGLAIGWVEAGDIAEAGAALDAAEAMPDLTVTVRSRLYELRGDIELHAGRLLEAGQAYAQALSLPDTEAHTRVLELKALGVGDPALAAELAGYLSLFETRSDAFTQGMARVLGAYRIRALPGHHALGSYLVARQLLNVQDAAAAVPLLEEAVARLADLPSDTFRRAARTELMSASVQTGDYDRARSILAELRAEAGIGNGHRLRYREWAARIDFFQAYFARGSAPRDPL